MDNQIIRFHNSNINKLDEFFGFFFALETSPVDIFIEIPNINPFTGERLDFYPKTNNPKWFIINYDDSLRIGEITYHPGLKFDSLIFEYIPDFSEIVQKFVNEIKIKMEISLFSKIVDSSDFIDYHEFALNEPKKRGRPKLPPEEMAARIVKVKEGLELQENDPSLRLKQLPGLVGYDWGDDFISIYKSFIRARDKLRKLENKYPEGDDPDGILDIVKELEMKTDT